MYLHCSLLKTVFFFSYSILVAYCYIYIIHLYYILSNVCIAVTTKLKTHTNNITNNNNKEKTTKKVYIKRSNHQTSKFFYL